MQFCHEHVFLKIKFYENDSRTKKQDCFGET